ncbi:MAG: hypothetical protein ACRDZ3_23425 [Acidimicrobiia bacterium]
MDVMVERCAALDVHKKTVMAAVRIPDGSGGRSQALREFRTFKRPQQQPGLPLIQQRQHLSEKPLQLLPTDLHQATLQRVTNLRVDPNQTHAFWADRSVGG